MIQHDKHAIPDNMIQHNKHVIPDNMIFILLRFYYILFNLLPFKLSMNKSPNMYCLYLWYSNMHRKSPTSCPCTLIMSY